MCMLKDTTRAERGDVILSGPQKQRAMNKLFIMVFRVLYYYTVGTSSRMSGYCSWYSS